MVSTSTNLLLQSSFAFLIFVTTRENDAVRAVSAQYNTVITPAAFTFGIAWTVIYTWLLAVHACYLFGYETLLQTENELHLTDIAHLLALTNALSGTWLVLFDAERISESYMAILCLWLALFVLWNKMQEFADSYSQWFFSGVGIYFAWVSIAACIETALFFDLSDLSSAALLLLMMAYLISIGKKSIGAVVIWALIGFAFPF